MPTRLLREGILTSERVDQLDAAGEVFYRRLMSKVDDHGYYDARPSILRTSLYPLRVDRVREADITRWIAACEKAGLIALYSHDGKPYMQMLDTKWVARSEPKCPPRTTENTSSQPQTPAALVVVVDVDVDDRARKRALVLPDWVPTEEWGAFLESRKKHPPTERAKRELIATLDKLRGQGHDPAKVLLQSTVNSWRDLFPLRASVAPPKPADKPPSCCLCHRASVGRHGGASYCADHMPVQDERVKGLAAGLAAARAA